MPPGQLKDLAGVNDVVPNSGYGTNGNIGDGGPASAYKIRDPGSESTPQLVELRYHPREVIELHCTYDPATRGGDAPDGRRPKATGDYQAWTPGS